MYLSIIWLFLLLFKDMINKLNLAPALFLGGLLLVFMGIIYGVSQSLIAGGVYLFFGLAMLGWAWYWRKKNA